MPSKKKFLRKSNLYLILDAEVNTYDELYLITKRVAGLGVDIVQLRDKKGTASEVIGLARKLIKCINGRIPFIINDRVDIAKAVGASGVHVGQDDFPVKEARKILGAKAIIGKSCQNFMHLGIGLKEGADYVGFGSVFKTLTKPDRNPMDLNILKKVARSTSLPIFAIGGIDEKSVPQLKQYGFTRFAVCRAISKSKNVQLAVAKLKRQICF